MKLLLEAKAESPQHPVAPLILGQLAMRKQQYPEARQYFDIAAALPLPDTWPESHRHRFQVLLQSLRCQLADKTQDVELARDSLSKWIQYEPDNRKLQQMLDSLPKGPTR